MLNVKAILTAAAGIGAVLYVIGKILKSRECEDEYDCAGCGDDEICKNCEYRSFCESCLFDSNDFTADCKSRKAGCCDFKCRKNSAEFAKNSKGGADS